MAASPASTSATTVGVSMAPYPTDPPPAAYVGPLGGVTLWHGRRAGAAGSLTGFRVCRICHQVHERCIFAAGSMYCARPDCRNPHHREPSPMSPEETPSVPAAQPGHSAARCPSMFARKLQGPVRPGCGGSGLPLCPGPRGGTELDVAPAAVPPAATARGALPVRVKEHRAAVTAGALTSTTGVKWPAVQGKPVQDHEQPTGDR